MNKPNNTLTALVKNLADPIWRIDNLYTIRDKNSRIVPFRLNLGQREILRHTHPRKLILKSRQIGISTLYVIVNLDMAIFEDGYQTGIQSYGRNESVKLYKKAIFSWERFPKELKQLLNVRLTASSATTGLEFSNDSVLRIGNFRGDTLQSLHVSELAKISSTYPNRAEELKTGAFEAVGQGNYITIETTAEGDVGLFPDMWATAETLRDTDVELTGLDFVPIFLPWMNDPDCNIHDRGLHKSDITPRLMTYFARLQKEFTLTLTLTLGSPLIQLPPATPRGAQLHLSESQLVWLVVKLRSLGSNFSREYPATPSMAFEQSIEGTYFKEQYEVLMEEKRVLALAYDSRFPVHTSWDLGINDETVVLFWQVVPGRVQYEIRLIDEYHATGAAIPELAKVVLEKPYTYDTHFVPHDANQRSYSVGETRMRTMQKHGLDNTQLLPRMSFADSIQVARSMILHPSFLVATNAVDLLSAMRIYRKQYDAKIQAYKDVDVHDIHSNYMAAFRYGAQGLLHLIEGITDTTSDSGESDLAI